jgi:glycosyltransferase involved in cell wall biosynthesis
MKQSLYVSHSKRGASHYYLDASARYRCVFPCEHNESDHTKHCIHFSQIDHIDLSEYQTVIFHRPSISLKLKRILKNLKHHNIKAIVDFDDLLFSPEYALQNPTYLSGKMTASYAKKSAKRYLSALRLFDFAQTSTEPLKQHLKTDHPSCNIEIIFNRVPEHWVNLTPAISAEQRLENKIIRYFPGTSHHSSNFKNAIKTLKLILDSNPDISLEVIGGINIPQNTFTKKQFKHLRPVMFEELPEIIAKSWLTISPLENNEFNNCKSALKFWESACFGVPVISNRIPDMSRLECDGLLLSNDHNQWLEFIEKVKNIKNYKQACCVAQKKSMKCIIPTDKKNGEIQNNTLELLMSSKFGPSWRAIRLNPTHQDFSACNDELKRSLNEDLNNSLDKEKIKKLTASALTKKKAYLSSEHKKHWFNKLRKLKRNPNLFFKDMIINMKG